MAEIIILNLLVIAAGFVTGFTIAAYRWYKAWTKGGL